MFETILIRAIRSFLGCFSNLMSEFPLTYQNEQSELIDEDWGEEIALNLPTAAAIYTKHKPYYTALHDNNV
jgi:hypothetical protein